METELFFFNLYLLSILLWVLWPVGIKLGKLSRYDLFYWDFLFGALFTVILFASIVYKLHASYISLSELAGVHFPYILRAFLGGALVSMAFLLRIISAFLAGIAFTFIVSSTSAIGIQCLIQILFQPHLRQETLGIALLFFVLTLACFSWISKKSVERGAVYKKPLFISLIAGLIIGIFYPLLEISYGLYESTRLIPGVASMIFMVGMLASYGIVFLLWRKTALFGKTLPSLSYFAVSWKYHLIPACSGAIWALGLCLKVTTDTASFHYPAYMLNQLIPIFIGLIGILIFKEFTGNKERKVLIFSSIFYLIGSIILSFNVA